MKEAIDRRQGVQKVALIEQFRRTPIVQIACEKAGIGRATYYRWRKEDADFADRADEAMREGVELVSDLAESKLINAIKEQNHGAISFWLRHRHPAYTEKLHIKGQVETKRELSDEEKLLIQKAIDMTFNINSLKNQDQYGEPSVADE